MFADGCVHVVRSWTSSGELANARPELLDNAVQRLVRRVRWGVVRKSHPHHVVLVFVHPLLAVAGVPIDARKSARCR